MPFEIVIEKAEAKTDANSKALYGLSEETRRNYNLQEFDLIKMYRVDYRKDEGKGNKKANINEAVIAASVVQKGREKMGKKRTLIGDEVTNLMLMSKRGDESEDYRKPIKHRGNDPVIGAANNELASLTNDAQDLATRGRLMQKSLHQKNDSNTERKRLIKESEHRRKIGQANRSVLPSAMKPHTIEEELDWAIHMTEKNDNLQRDLFRLESEARHIKSGRADDDRSDATEDSASTASKSVRSRKEARIVKNTETHESLQNVR